MKTMIRKSLLMCFAMSIVLIFTAFNAASAEEIIIISSGSCGENVTYNVDSAGTLTVSGSGKMDDYGSYVYVPWYPNVSSITKVVIEDGVTNIGRNAFLGCKYLTDVTISDSVTSIGNQAFHSCERLAEISIPDNVTSIGASAFRYCYLLTDIVIPEGVTSIGDQAFERCSSLATVTISDSVTSIGKDAFYYCRALENVYAESLEGWLGIAFNGIDSNPMQYASKLYIGGEPIGDVVIPESITEIRDNALACCGVTSVTIPDGVTSIGAGAFQACYSLTSVTIPDSVTSIGAGAFSNCNGLTKVTAESLEGWLSIAFANSSSNPLYIAKKLYIGNTLAASITIPDGVTEIGQYAFMYCNSLTSITIPDSVTAIGDYAFNNCSKLTQITIPDSVTEIGQYAFTGCSVLTKVYAESLEGWLGISFEDSYSNPLNAANTAANLYVNSKLTTDIIIPEGVTTIGDYAFSGCGSILSVTISNGVTSIGDHAFSGCTQITGITIPDSVNAIGESAFRNCDGLTSITIPKNVASMGTSAFAYCDNLKTIMLQDGIPGIGSYAFSNCTGLTSITIPDSVTTIGEHAFSGCSKLNAITLKNSLLNIDSYAFSGCTGLTSITIPGSVTTIGSNIFSECSNLKSITLQEGIRNIGESAFSNCRSITSISIPGSVNSIGDYAFYNCTGLTSITIPDGVTNIGYYAFDSCTGLTSISIPDSVTMIGDEAFNYCINLKDVYAESMEGWLGIEFGNASGNPLSEAVNLYIDGKLTVDVVIPDGVTRIGDYAFEGYSKLNSITIPDSVTNIGQAFYYCTNLTGVYAESLEGWLGIEFDDSYLVPYSNPLFYAGNLYIGGELAVDIVIPDGITEIKPYAFYYCSSLESVSVPESVTHIDGYAFSNCIGLKCIALESGQTSIADNAFSNCTGVEEVFLSDAMEKMINLPVDYSLISFHCSMGSPTALMLAAWELKFIDDGFVMMHILENGVSKELQLYGYVGEDAEIIIPDGVTDIEESAFKDCAGLTKVIVPESCIYIGAFAFSGCTGLKDVVLPDGVASIDGTSFEAEAMIHSNPETVTALALAKAGYAFRYGDYIMECLYEDNVITGSRICKYVGTANEIIIPEIVTVIGTEAFADMPNLQGRLVIPENVAVIESEAFYDCSGFTGELALHDHLQAIGARAFYGCTGFENRIIIIPKSVTELAEDAFEASGMRAVTADVYDYDLCVGYDLNDDGTITFAQYLGAATDYSIPETIGDKAVVAIKGGAFKDQPSMTGELIVPDTIAVIEDNAFAGAAFSSVTMPVRFAQTGSFSRACFLLDYFDDAYSSVKHVIFTGEGNLGQYAFSCTNVESVDLSRAKVGSISSYAFTTSTKLTQVILPEGLQTIEEYAFYKCAALTGVSLPEGLKSIGAYAFKNCSSITEMIIPDSVVSLGAGSLACSALTKLSMPSHLGVRANDAYSDYRTTCLYYTMESYCNSLKELIITGNKGTIEDFAFTKLKGLESLTFKKNAVKKIGFGAFLGIASLETLTFEDYSVELIEATAFSMAGCESNLSGKLVLPEGLLEIGYGVFSGCKNFTGLSTPSTLKIIGELAFNGWSSLISVEFDGDECVINKQAFKDNTTLETITFEDYSVSEIGEQAFSTCIHLGDLTLPEGLKIIGKKAFENNLGITKLTTPSTLRSIGDYAFDTCLFIKELYFDGDFCRIGAHAFESAVYAEIAEFKDNSIYSIGAYAFQDCAFIDNKIVFGDGLYSIAGNAFAGTSVNTVYFSEGLNSLSTYAFAKEMTFYAPYGGATALTLGKAGYEFTDPDRHNMRFSYEEVGGKDTFTLLSSEDDGASNIVVPEGVTAIREYVFNDNDSLKTIILPSSLKEISPYAFVDCSKLTSITIPDNVAELSAYSFYRCTALKSVLLGYDLYSIEDETFKYCTNLENVYCYKNSAAYDWAEKMGYSIILLDNYNGLEYITISGPSEIGMNIGDTHDLKDRFTFSLVPVGGISLVWESFDEDIATCENGMVKAISEGDAVVRVSLKNHASVYRDVKVTVYADMIDFVVPEEIYLFTGESMKLVCELIPSNANPNIRWTIDKSIASVSGNMISAGRVQGTATITAVSSNGITKRISLFVCGPVSSISLSETKEVLHCYEREHLIATAEAGRYQLVNKRLAFSSNAPDVLSIDQDGNLVPRKPGIATITVCSENGVSVSRTFRVREAEILNLPMALERIEASAFEGIFAEVIVLSENVESIGENAFSNAPNLCAVVAANPNVQLADTAFFDCESIIFFVSSDGMVTEFAANHGFDVIYTD